jgi:hypothetical protein
MMEKLMEKLLDKKMDKMMGLELEQLRKETLSEILSVS